MTKNTLCLAPVIKLVSFELFVEFLPRKNNNVTKRPLFDFKWRNDMEWISDANRNNEDICKMEKKNNCWNSWEHCLKLALWRKMCQPYRMHFQQIGTRMFSLRYVCCTVIETKIIYSLKIQAKNGEHSKGTRKAITLNSIEHFYLKYKCVFTIWQLSFPFLY